MVWTFGISNPESWLALNTCLQGAKASLKQLDSLCKCVQLMPFTEKNNNKNLQLLFSAFLDCEMGKLCTS